MEEEEGGSSSGLGAADCDAMVDGDGEVGEVFAE